MNRHNVFITGMGFITSIGNDVDSVLSSLLSLEHGIVEFNPSEGKKGSCPIKVIGSIKNFNTESIDPEDWLYPERYKFKRDMLRGLSPHGLYAFCAIRQAIEDASLTSNQISNDHTGLYTASAGSQKSTYGHMVKMMKVGPMRCFPLAIVASIAGTLNFNLVAYLKIKGSSCGFVTACASSAHALGMAFDEISLGRQQKIIVVGAEDGDYYSIVPFSAMRALSTSTDIKTSRPFDKNRSGFVGTGGASVLILESEESAKERQVKTYARFIGWGQASDGHNVAISHPEGEGLICAMRNALNSTNLKPNDIDYINAHATSTTIGDLSEIRAINKVFDQDYSPAISSTKALTGHGLSLSSVMESAFSVLAMNNGFMPGSAHIQQLDDEALRLNIITKNKNSTPRFIMSNSSGFGGANVSLIFSSI